MSCDAFKVGVRVEAVREFQIQEALAAPVGANTHQIRLGDTGEVAQKRVAGNFHWLIIRWHRLGRSLNLERGQFDFVKAISP